MARHLTPLHDHLASGELSSLVGLPIHSDGDAAGLALTSDEWTALLQRRRLVGWPLQRTHADAEELAHA
jgi:hypothetical protein